MDYVLSEHHRQHLQGSGLSDATIAVARFYSLDGTPEHARLAGQILNRTGVGPVPSLVVPIFDSTGVMVAQVLRPDNPVASADGHAPKYVQPSDTAPRLYYAPPELIPPDQYLNVAQPLLLTEGVKKCLAAAQTGMAAIAGQGVTLFHDVEHRRKTDLWRLHADFEGIPLQQRPVFIAFDGGDTTVNVSVIEAEARLARMLIDTGAVVKLLRIPALAAIKVGLDDYLVKQQDAAAALKDLCNTALHANPVDRARMAMLAADRIAAGQQLLSDPSFAAAIHIGGAVVLDGVYAHLTRAKIGKKTIQTAVTNFRGQLSQKAAASAPAAQTNAALCAESEQLLNDPQLILIYLEDIAADGLVGEQRPAVTFLFVAVSRNMAEPIHAVAKAASSAGKNHTVDAATRFVPPEDIISISDMTPKALLYYNESLNGKVIIVAEHEGSERADYPCRLMMSERKLTVMSTEKVVDEDGSHLATHLHSIDASASLITTTTRPTIHNENETRVLEVVLDESMEQTQRIMAQQALRAAQPPTQAARVQREHRHEVWQQALRMLVTREVIVPQAHNLLSDIPAGRVRARRDFPRLLELVKACALLHQRQRQLTAEGYILATDYDVEMARWLADSMSGTMSPRLAAVAKTIEKAFGAKGFTAKEAATKIGYTTDGMRRVLKDLEGEDVVEVKDKGKGALGTTWCIKGAQTLPPMYSPPSSSAAAPSSPGATSSITSPRGTSTDPGPVAAVPATLQ